MDGQIKNMLEQGLSRDEIFKELQPQTINEIKLANKIATFRVWRETGLSSLLNWILCGLALVQGCYAAWVIHTSLVARDEVFAQFGVIVVLALTWLYLFNLVRMSFSGYSSFLLFCFMAAAHYVYIFPATPFLSVAGLSLASTAGVLAYYLKIRLFPHMGMLDVRQDGRGQYILE